MRRDKKTREVSYLSKRRKNGIVRGMENGEWRMENYKAMTQARISIYIAANYRTGSSVIHSVSTVHASGGWQPVADGDDGWRTWTEHVALS
jgi:hypothetical protein